MNAIIKEVTAMLVMLFGGVSELSPQNLYDKGDTGFWLTAYDNTYLKVNPDGTGGSVASGGTVGRWDDRSGGNNHFSQPTDTLRPVFMSDDGVGFHYGPTGNSDMRNLALAAIDRDDCSGGAVMDFNGIQQPHTVIGLGEDALNIYAGQADVANYQNMKYNAGSEMPTPLLVTGRRTTVSWSSSGSAFKLWVNGLAYSDNALAGNSMTKAYLNRIFSNNGSSIRIKEIALFRRAITDSEMASFNRYLRTKAGAVDNNSVLVFLGASNTLGYGSETSLPYPLRLTNRQDSLHYVYATGAQSIETPYATAVQVAALKGATECIVVLDIGEADVLLGTATGAETEGFIAAYAVALRAAGCKVIVKTMQQLPDNDAEAQAFNTLLLSNYPSYADALVDVRTALPDFTDATYFHSDQLHWKDAAHVVVAGLMDAAMIGL